MGIPFGFGVRFLYDQHLNYWRPGLPVALRIRNYVTPTTGYSELGFQYSPSGQMQDLSGFSDIPIVPRPEVTDMSMRGTSDEKDIGLNQARLYFGSKLFYVSNTFVRGRLNEANYSDGYQVWRDPSVIGLVYPFITPTPPVPPQSVQQRLYRIETVTFNEVAGEIVSWTLGASAQEVPVTVSGS